MTLFHLKLIDIQFSMIKSRTSLHLRGRLFSSDSRLVAAFGLSLPPAALLLHTDDGMAGIDGSSVKRSCGHHLAPAASKIEPDHFPDGKKLMCLGLARGPEVYVDMRVFRWELSVE